MHTIITLYDIPSKLPENAWSPNTWKARFALTYKQLPHRTVWIEYPDIAALCQQLGAPPTSVEADGSPHYTLPVIYDPTTGAVVADSCAIGEYLDATYPDTQRLFPAGTLALQHAFLTALEKTLLTGLWPIILPAGCARMNPPSAEFYRRTREAAYGKRMEEFAPGEKRWECWRELESGFGVLDRWLAADGPYVMGQTVSFADITIASYLVFIRLVLGANSVEWKDMLQWHGGRWGEFSEKFKEYEYVV